jgi:hypothetical protein
MVAGESVQILLLVRKYNMFHQILFAGEDAVRRSTGLGELVESGVQNGK